MKQARMITWGVVLVIAGVALILIQAGVIPWRASWWLPAIFLGLSVFFHILYFSGGRREAGVLVPGGLFLTYGLLLAVSAALGGHWLWRLSGFWVAGPAVGIAEMKIASRGREGSWSAVGVLLAVAAALLMMTNARLSFRGAAGIALVAWGAAIILHEGFHNRGKQAPEKEKD